MTTFSSLDFIQSVDLIIFNKPLMKKNLFIILLLPLVSFSQISISKSNFPSSGDEYIYRNASTNGIDISQTGANQTWDYTQLTPLSFDTINYVGVTSTPIVYQFYFNNIILYSNYKANYAIKGADFQDPTNQVTISDVYQFHKKNNSSLQMVGFGANINGVPASIKYDIIDQLYPLPLAFGVSDSTTGHYILDVPTLGAYGQHLKRKVEVDGWGSLATPFQNYNQSLRVKTTLYQRDTLKVDQPLNLPGVAFNRPIQTTYEWFVLGIGAPVLSVTKQANVVSNVEYIDGSHASIGEKNNFELTLFPNPATETITIAIPFDEALMKVVDMNGKVVYNGLYSKTLTVSSFSKGNYLLIITKEDKIAYHYFQKL